MTKGKLIQRKLSKGKLACLVAAIAIGAALIGAPAQARGSHGMAMHSAMVHGAAWHGAAWHSGWHGGYFPHHRFAFFHRRRFGPFFGAYASVYPSCWSWVVTPFGWRHVWVCGPYGYGYY